MALNVKSKAKSEKRKIKMWGQGIAKKPRFTCPYTVSMV